MSADHWSIEICVESESRLDEKESEPKKAYASAHPFTGRFDQIIIIPQNIINTEQTARIFFAASIYLWPYREKKKQKRGDKNRALFLPVSLALVNRFL